MNLTFILPIIAVVAGFAITLIFKPSVSKGVKLLLSFSGAFLLSITIFEFLPELYSSGIEDVGIFIMLGLVLQLLLEFLSHGAEHGHMHADASRTTIPWLLLLSLSLHSLLEGFPLTDNTDLLYGIVIHKIPIAVIISSFLLLSNISKTQIAFFLIVFALMTPLGSYLATLSIWSTLWKIRISAMVVGVLLHISTTILFESSKNHQFNTSKFAAILVGIGLAYLL
ncbi:ZIP family metal transporter [Flavimarina sp. Hel_I_48]|uniref:ZIP family metal transporter n=1 Tax=Flavimarina sp. Hel_I_48 TaxID=1392488 RepID=UPI000AE3F562|nr:ZIP family metal transporter [Flavimarina sp. Hel_I_48]